VETTGGKREKKGRSSKEGVDALEGKLRSLAKHKNQIAWAGEIHRYLLKGVAVSENKLSPLLVLERDRRIDRGICNGREKKHNRDK